jgi:hypothetical protein
MGDIIIALPIADYYIEQGWEVFWPIDAAFVEMFARIKPAINFLGVTRPATPDQNYFLHAPLRLLVENKCDRTVVLYSYLGGMNLADPRLANSLKFDEYKYAIAGVPFERKWTLEYERDIESEEALFESLKISGDYVLIHDRSTEMAAPVEISPDLTRGLELVRIASVTDSIFDWRLTIERASKLIMVNSCFANLVEGLNLENEKLLFLYSPVAFTPVFANNWRFIYPKEPIKYVGAFSEDEPN